MRTPFRIAPRRSACALLLLSQLVACYAYHPSGTPEQAGTGIISEARLSLRNGTQPSLRDVRVRSDSVVGFAGNLWVRRAIPAADVVFIERHEVSTRRTSALLLGTAAVASFVLVVMNNSRGHQATPLASPASVR